MDRMRNHMRMAHSHARYGRLARELEMASVIGRGRFGRADFIVSLSRLIYCECLDLILSFLA
jgi:hypothetical protein